MAEYSIVSAILAAGAVALEVLWLRTGILRTAQYWLSMLIVFGFQVLVDGWLTRLDRPTVIYRSDKFLGIRWPFDIPIEDFVFGFAMITLAMLVWAKGSSKDRRSEVA